MPSSSGSQAPPTTTNNLSDQIIWRVPSWLPNYWKAPNLSPKLIGGHQVGYQIMWKATRHQIRHQIIGRHQIHHQIIWRVPSRLPNYWKATRHQVRHQIIWKAHPKSVTELFERYHIKTMFYFDKLN